MSKQENPPCPLCQEPLSPIIDKDEEPITRFRCRKHGEFNYVAVVLPKTIIDFLRASEEYLGTSMEEYLGYSLIEAVEADLNAGDIFIPTAQQLIEKHNLQNVFKALKASTVGLV